MKKLKDYIIESQNFLVNKKLKNRQNKYEYHPKTYGELKDIIIDLLKKGETDLNCIDVSNIEDMSWLFSEVSDSIKVKEIDISEWDVSNVNDMHNMFFGCIKFNSDLSDWNVSDVEDMRYMFYSCEEFNADLSKWDVSKTKYKEHMFYSCDTLKKNNKIPKWYKGRV